MTNKVMEHIGFQSLLTKIQLFTLILLEFNTFLQKYLAKSKTNPLYTKYLEHNVMILLCADFIVSPS